MFKEILLYPNDFLTTTCTPVESLVEAEPILKEMENTITNVPYAIGLSANQIGFDKQICLLRDPKDQSLLRLINPTYQTDPSAELILRREMCLSLPGTYVALNAPEDLTIEFLDEKWEKKTLALTDPLMARAFLHEWNHLHGKTIVERCNSITRSSALTRYRKFVTRKYNKVKAH